MFIDFLESKGGEGRREGRGQRERKRERERERSKEGRKEGNIYVEEKYQLVASHIYLSVDRTHNLLVYQMMPVWPGHPSIFFTSSLISYWKYCRGFFCCFFLNCSSQ